MNEMASVIVVFWLLPVTLSIIIPLLMLYGWTILKLFMRLKIRRDVSKQNDELDDVLIQTEKSR